jgi:hypothetical protein
MIFGRKKTNREADKIWTAGQFKLNGIYDEILKGMATIS